MRPRLRIFVSSPSDVKAAREVAALTIERLAQDYARFFSIEPYLWEYEAMVAAGHFQDSIEPPSKFDIVVLILWSRLGTLLPERTAVREYRGMDGRTPITGTEWEFEEAFSAAKQSGIPDLLVYRSLKPAPFDTHDIHRFEQQSLQLRALNSFWQRHFEIQGQFIGAFTLFTSDREFAEGLERHLRKLIEKRIAAQRSPGDNLTARAWAQAPFRGLESYEYEHAPIFFGQDEALSKAMLQIAANAENGSAFLLVLGASGSGKSSLVKSGILPKLFVPRRIPGIAFLRWVIFRPSDAQAGEDLFDALARRLATQSGEMEGLSELIGLGQSLSSLAAHFRDAAAAPIYPIETALGLLTGRARESGRMLEYETARLVLVIDQFEELFNNENVPTDARRRFVQLLKALANSGHVWVLATMRKDFWHRADETPDLVSLSEGIGRLDLTPPGAVQLSQMIRRPAEAAGIQFESHATSNVALNEVIAEKVAQEPGALPLLSYLLDQLYRIDILRAHGTSFTYATYEGLGRLEGAIATQAEAALERCPPEERTALGSLLFALVDMDSGTGDADRAIARRIPLSTFEAGTPQRRLIDALLDPEARLLVTDMGQGGISTVRVAHEALISRWERASEFVRKNAHSLRVRRRIEERYALWSSLGYGVQNHRVAARPTRFSPEQALLRDIDLIDAQRLLEERRADTEPHLVAYIERSSAEDRRLRTRTIRVLTGVAIIVTILAVVAAAAGSVASRKQREAEYQTQETLKSQARLLTGAAAQRLKEMDLPAAQGIILEVLTNPVFAQSRTPASINVFQEVRAADAELAVLIGHLDGARTARYSPDGTRVVSASRDKSIRVWDARTGVQLAVITGHSDRVNFAVYSPDGTRILSASRDKTARIWDAGSGAQLAVLAGHSQAVTSAIYSPDGTHVVTASYDKTARIWDARSGTCLTVLNGHTDIVNSAFYSSDGSRIVTASFDKTARIWDARTGSQLAVLAGHSAIVSTAAFSPDGSRIVTSSADKTVRIWDARTGAQVALLSGHGDIVYSALYSPDGSRIVTASADRTSRIWDARSGAQLAVFSGHGDITTSAAYSPDATRIVTASLDNTVRIWNASGNAPLATLMGHEDGVETAVYSPDGTRILTAARDNTARLWNANTGALLTVLSGHSGFVQSATYSPDGSRIVTASRDKTARIWDAHTGTALAVLAGHGDVVNFAAFSPDGASIVTASFDKTARTWDAKTGAPLLVLSGHGGNVNSAGYSPDGRHIVTGSEDKTARVWDAQTGVQLAVLQGHNDSVETAAYSPDGARIVTASLDKSARIWDVKSGLLLSELSGVREPFTSAAYSFDGTHIVTTSNDTARIWDAVTGTQLAVIAGHGGELSFATFSPHGANIVTASADMTARIWNARIPADLPAQISWYAAAQTDPLPEADRIELGLPRETKPSWWGSKGSACDRSASSFYDPDRVAIGLQQADIDGAVAVAACSADLKSSNPTGRADYLLGRALLANGDVSGAKRQFHRAADAGYRAANLDLARLLENAADMTGALALYEKAWRSGVVRAAFELGRVHEIGSPILTGAQAQREPDLKNAWSWYQLAVNAGEPAALARFGERAERSAIAQNDSAKRKALLLDAFRYYACAAKRAKSDGWPDDASKPWRYRRATLARLLANQGMMKEVAEAFQTVSNGSAHTPPSAWQSIKNDLDL
ncbi:MAG TPA: hypothetical protein VHW71_11260 [Steroidobacteraceae bacterium]|jgi:WD40 repeat protein|nr:hypothetical protein [Steroidobacteraceae bacterium]